MREKAVMVSNEDTGNITIKYEVELTEDEVIKYITLDALLGSEEHNDIDELIDLMVEIGWSWVDGVLMTSTWESLDNMLQFAENIVKAYKQEEVQV